jgi:tRNA nucleotidyltransferase (CCA-adding enzyme)
MHIILTHEQADFDAIASLLAAFTLNENSHPVLPIRINRNVRAFISLYGDEFPFISIKEIPAGPIEKITLVDTQSMSVPRGVTKSTEINVIDHHPKRTKLNPSWGCNIQKNGANATVLVENIQENKIWISQFHATLMLLGIYEDTGRLSYAKTTPRDIRAAAYLLEQGADLQMVGEFLNYPLSEVQQAVYQSAKKNMQALSVSGRNILICKAIDVDMQDELSSIVHKLRDNFEADVIILFAEINSGVQIVMRATVDGVDLGALARHFGGGGHIRAAAALVTNTNIEKVEKDFRKVIINFISPQLQIKQIMSERPHLLEFNLSVNEADDQMKKYGFEGFPVIQDGALVGLLTRKEVDKAISHQMNVPIKELMSAGTHFLSSNQTIDDVQNLMLDSGWGQIPIIENGAIKGIVTRTDLIKALSKNGLDSGKINWEKRIIKILSPIQIGLLKLIAQISKELLMPIYVVGGVVRDIRMERASLDYDLVVEGNAIDLGNSLANHFGGDVVTHNRFGTAKWKISAIKGDLAKSLSDHLGFLVAEEELPETIDLVSARREFYQHPTALPTVEHGSIKLDLHRRDFTINTLALRLDEPFFGDLLDYWGGMADIRAKKIRVLHSLSFIDDPTRILRAVRFEKNFKFNIDERTEDLLISALPLLQKISGDRIRRELISIFKSHNLKASLERLRELNVLKSIHKNFPSNDEVFNRIDWATNIEFPMIWENEEIINGFSDAIKLVFHVIMLDMKREEINSLSTRLKLSTKLNSSIVDGTKLYQAQLEIIELRNSQVFNIFENCSSMVLYVNYQLSDNVKFRDKIIQYLHDWRFVKPFTSGQKLRNLKIDSGPRYAQILDSIKSAWLDGEIKNEAEEKVFLNGLLKNEK